MKTKLKKVLIPLFFSFFIWVAADYTHVIEAAPSSNNEAVLQEPININTADAEGLLLIKGVGPILADRILLHRESEGSFESIEDVMLVRGIGESKYQQIKSEITV